MRDVPGDSLVARLVECRLCTTADVQRARRLVRRMTRDLPAFDSVWIDALTQLKVLTPFQARVLEDSPPEALHTGEYIVRNSLSGGAAGGTCLAIGPDRRQVVLKRLSVPPEQATAIALRLELLVERARHVVHPQWAVPFQLVRTHAACFLVSRFVPGLDLQELLIRRGRFPEQIVTLLADHLLSALATWHGAGLTHGDLRLTKIRLTPQGQIVLVDGGVQPAVSPELMVHTVQSPELAEVIAPERIGTNQPATAASDLYSLGCVLWHLLAGRAPHSQTDPLAKLAAHQTKRIPDVREFAPDTPPRLAELIAQLTAPQPQDRPARAETARRQLGSRGVPATRPLARFRRQFDATVPHLATRAPRSAHRWTGMTAAVLLLGAITVALSDRGLRTQLLHIAEQSWTESLDHTTEPQLATAENPPADAGLLPIPPANARGVITLTETGPYAATELSAIGPLTVQAGPGIRPRIVIEHASWSITAQQIVLKGLDIDGHALSPDSPLDALLTLQAQSFQVQGCQFMGPVPETDSESVKQLSVPKGLEVEMVSQSAVGSPRPQLTAIAWEPSDHRDPQAGMVLIENSVFAGAMHGVTCHSAPRKIVWKQVLKIDAGSAVVVTKTRAAVDLAFLLEHVTLRHAGPVLSCAGPLVEESSAAAIEVEAVASVFEVVAGSALVELIGPQVRPDWPHAVRMIGDGTLIRPDTMLLSSVDLAEASSSALESDDLQFEGLFIDDFEFAGPERMSYPAAQLATTHAPRRQTDPLPGVDVTKLPRP